MIWWIIVIFLFAALAAGLLEGWKIWQVKKQAPTLSQVLQADDAEAAKLVSGVEGEADKLVADVKDEADKLPGAAGVATPAAQPTPAVGSTAV